MAFLTDKWTIARIDLNNMLLVRIIKNEIVLESIMKDIKENSKEVLAREVLEEYDLAIDSPNHIYIIYQNKEMDLILTTIKNKKVEEVKLTSSPITEVFNLNIIVKDKKIHIIYQIRIQNKEKNYRIDHYYYDGIRWTNYVIEETLAKKALNPLKCISIGDKILLSYYNSDNSIVLKEFNLDKLEWTGSINLVNTINDKLYLDMLKIENTIHLTYCEFVDGNLIVKYEKSSYHDGEIKKDIGKSISNEGSPYNPTLIFYKQKLWITWIELDKIMSRYSEDNGHNWGPIYMWNNSKKINFVRYKYLDMITEEDIVLDYSFGEIYPEISFMGFGPTDKAIEIPVKKKKLMNLPRI